MPALYKRLFEEIDQMLYPGNILKVINNFENCQNLFKYRFILWHFAMGDPLYQYFVFQVALVLHTK